MKKNTTQKSINPEPCKNDNHPIKSKKVRNEQKPKNNTAKTQNTLPKTISFEDKYLNMMISHPNIAHIESNIDYIKILKDTIEEEGGMVQVTSNGMWGKVTSKINSSHNKSNIQNLLNQDKIFKYSQQYLFPYFYAVDHRKKQVQLYYIPLCKSKFVEKDIFHECLKDLSKGLQYYDEPMVVFRNCQKQTKLNLDIINLQYAGQIYGDSIIDIRIQKQCQYGYKAQKLCNFQYQMKVKEYREYQQNYNNPQFLDKFKHYKVIKDGKLFFGVNFDAEKRGNDVINKEIISKLSGTFLGNKGQFDLLSYLDEDIPGCSLPQIYFKVKGCWTGGHQQNCNMSSININHGPDASEWYAVDFQYCEELREAIQAEYKIDIYLNQGLWFSKWQWLVQKGIPVRKIEQKKGDIVVLGFGTLHWVRSLGVSMHSSWNLMIKDQSQVKRALERHTQNKKIKFPRKHIIPLKSIMLRYLNHQYFIMANEMKLTVNQKIREWLKQQKNNLQKILIKRQLTITEQYIEDLQSYCDICKDQVLLYYSDHPEIQNNKGIICLGCYVQINHNQNNIYTKFAVNSIEQLLKISVQPFQTKQIDNLCKGKYIGNVPCQKIKQQPRMEIEICQEKNNNNQIIAAKKKEQSVKTPSINQKSSTIPADHISLTQVSKELNTPQIEEGQVSSSYCPNHEQRSRSRNKQLHTNFNNNFQNSPKNNYNNQTHQNKNKKNKKNKQKNIQQILCVSRYFYGGRYKEKRLTVYSNKSQFSNLHQDNYMWQLNKIDNNYKINNVDINSKKNYYKTRQKYD